MGTEPAYAMGVTCRIDTSQDGVEARIAFEGLLDQDALDAIVVLVAAARKGGAHVVRLMLGVGSSVDGSCIGRLTSIDALTVEAASPFLSHWLRQAGPRNIRSQEPS